MSESMNNIEIHKTANGYLVHGTYSHTEAESYSNMRTFESFDSMVDWLRDNFGERKTEYVLPNYPDINYWGGLKYGFDKQNEPSGGADEQK